MIVLSEISIPESLINYAYRTLHSLNICETQLHYNIITGNEIIHYMFQLLKAIFGRWKLTHTLKI